MLAINNLLHITRLKPFIPSGLSLTVLTADFTTDSNSTEGELQNEQPLKLNYRMQNTM